MLELLELKVMPEILIRDDLSSLTIREDGRQLPLGPVNPLTQERFASADAVRQFVRQVEADGRYWSAPETEGDDARAMAINAYRDQLIDAGFEFQGVVYQSRPEDRENMAGAATLALAAITNGALEGDYGWADAQSDFEWIAADNSTHKMDAQTMFDLGAAALAHKQAHIFAARALKDADPTPDDWQHPDYWP